MNRTNQGDTMYGLLAADDEYLHGSRDLEWITAVHAETPGSHMIVKGEDGWRDYIPEDSEWGTDHWGEVMSEPTQEHARKVATASHAKVYYRVPGGLWVKEWNAGDE